MTNQPPGVPGQPQQPPHPGQYLPPPGQYQQPQYPPGPPPGWQLPPAPPPQKKRHTLRTVLLSLTGVFVLIIIIAAVAGGGSNPSTSNTGAQAATVTNPPPAAGSAGSGTGTSSSTRSGSGSGQSSSAPHVTAAQQQAIQAAQSYLSDGQGFSKAGLTKQLDSNFGSGFSRKLAVFAVSHLKVNWDHQAVISAKGYLHTGEGFSRDGLIQQLHSSFGSGFTLAQAEYAAKKVGL